MKAFLVLGGESTGTRMVTQFLVEAGCYGSSAHHQPLDNLIPEVDMLVWRRSVPHAREMPDIERMVMDLQLAGYEVTAVITMRDWFCTSRSQVDAPHVDTTEESIANLQAAYRWIFATLPHSISYVMVNYESFVLSGKDAIDTFYQSLGLEPVDTVQVFNGNGRYYVA